MQTIKEKVIEATVMLAFSYVPGLVAKGITLAKKGIERVFGAGNEAESDSVGKIEEVAENAENVLAGHQRKELMIWMAIDPTAKKKPKRLGCQRMTSTVAERGEIEEEEESHDSRVAPNESRSGSRKRKERGNYNYDNLMIMPPSRGLEEDPQSFCTYKYGDDGRFALIYSSTTTQFKWTCPDTVGLRFPFTFAFHGFRDGPTALLSQENYTGTTGITLRVVLGRVKCRFIHIVDILPRPYLLTLEAWADSSSGRWTFVFFVFTFPSDFDPYIIRRRAEEFFRRRGVLAFTSVVTTDITRIGIPSSTLSGDWDDLDGNPFVSGILYPKVPMRVVLCMGPRFDFDKFHYPFLFN